MKMGLKRFFLYAAILGFLQMLLTFWLMAAMAEAQDALAYGSRQHPVLNRLAQQHADAMARTQYQSHDGFSHRFTLAQRGTGLGQVAEICAECWPHQRNATWQGQWAEYETCWRQSPGHWSVARA